MNPEEQAPGISIDFLVGDRNIPVPILNGILFSLQQAIYVVGAHETGRERLRGASRQRYTLAIASVHHSDLHIDLVPVAQMATEQLSLFGQVAINMASNALYDAAKIAFSKMKGHYEGKHPESSVAPDSAQSPDDVLFEQSVWQTSCRNATEVVRLGGSVRTTLRTPSGAEVAFEATPASAGRIIEQEAIMRGQAQTFRGCEVRSISIPGPTLRARFPIYNNAEVHCVCQTPATTIAEAHVRIHQKYSIVGIPVWGKNRPRQGRPTRVEVITLQDAHGDVILTSIFDEHEDQDIQLAGYDGGLFPPTEEMAN